MTELDFAEQRGRDALSFERLPPASWLAIRSDGITIKVYYGEKLSILLRKMPGARWVDREQAWHLSFAAVEPLRAAFAEIDALAGEAARAAESRQASRAALKIHHAQEADRARSAGRPISLRPEYLRPSPGRPRFALQLEAIGDDLAERFRSLGMRRREWVAQIFGSDGRGGWVRGFIHGVRDYSAANSIGSRGVAVNFQLDEGIIYEISSPESWKSTDRYFAIIEAGHLRRLTRQEVEACLAN